MLSSYPIRNLVYANGSPVAFSADDARASTISLERLLGLGLGLQGHAYAVHHLHHWGWLFARDTLTNFKQIVEHLSSEESVALHGGVAAWARTHWPRLEIDEGRRVDARLLSRSLRVG